MASKTMKHDFTDFVVINGSQVCKYCHISRDNDMLPTYCYDKTQAVTQQSSLERRKAMPTPTDKDREIPKVLQLILDNPHGIDQQLTMFLRDVVLDEVMPPVRKKLGNVPIVQRDRALIDKALVKYVPLLRVLFDAYLTRRLNEVRAEAQLQILDELPISGFVKANGDRQDAVVWQEIVERQGKLTKYLTDLPKEHPSNDSGEEGKL